MADEKTLPELTPAQQEMIEQCRLEWQAHCRSTEPCDFEAAKLAAIEAYQQADLPPPQFFFLADSPRSAVIMGDFLTYLFDQNRSDSGHAHAWAAVLKNEYNLPSDSRLYQRVVADTIRQLHKEVGMQRLINEGKECFKGVDPREIGDPTQFSWKPDRGGLETQARAQGYGCHDAAWLGFYNFVLTELKVDTLKPLTGLLKLSQSCGWWTPLRDVAIFQHRPTELHLNAEGRPHCDGGPAIAYRDGWKLFSLNGVRVDEAIAVTPGDQLDPKMMIKIDNADVRREFVRKVGINRLLSSFDSKVLDRDDDTTGGPYELVLLNLGDGRERPYLKMKNPSAPGEVWHVEGVPPGTKTVAEALDYRNGSKTRPESVT